MLPVGSRAMSMPPSEFEPPRNVAKGRAEPVAFSSAISASEPPPLNVVSGAPAVTGKSADDVLPVNHAFPEVSRTIDAAESKSDPPMKVEYTNAEPAGLNLVTNASPLLNVVSYAPGVVGQSAEGVPPAMYALPPPSTVNPPALSKSL